MSLLTIIQTACSKSQIPIPTSVVGNQDPQVVELLKHAQLEGQELAQAVPWEELTKEQTFTTTAAAIQTGAIPSDFDRFVPDTMFNRDLRRRVHGPISQQDWQMRQAFPAALTVQYWFRLRGGNLLMTPTPAAGQTIAYEYISTQWCESSGGTPQTAWAADDDVALISEPLIAIGVELRWKMSQNLPWDDVNARRMEQLAKIATKQAGMPTLTIGARNWRMWGVNIPDGNFPSS